MAVGGDAQSSVVAAPDGDDDGSGLDLKPWSAFAYRDFTMLWLGGVAMMVAQFMRLLTSIQWVFEETDSEALLGLLGAVQFIQMPFVIYGGALADVVDRKKLMAMTQIVSLISLVLVSVAAFSGSLEVWHIFVIHGVTGVVNMLGSSARPAMISRVVPRTHVTHAVTTNTGTFQVAAIVAPIMFGIVFTVFGVGAAFAVGAVVAAISVVTPFLIRVSGEPEGGSRRVTLRSLKEGFTFVRRHKILPGLYLLDIGVTVMSFYRFLFPIFADGLYDMGAVAVGLLNAFNSAGGLLGSVVVLYTARFARKGLLVLIATAVYGVLLIAFGTVEIFAIGLLIVVGLGMTDAIGMTMRQTVVQLTTPDRLLGRASSAHSFAAMGANNVGQVEVAFMSGGIGAGPTMILGGVVSIIVVGLIWKFVPGVSAYRYEPGSERNAAEHADD
ncbi:MAG: MFS transporter [Chloroflexi bacterium]|nr:MFS transporter [Chloroflexota bacterium]